MFRGPILLSLFRLIQEYQSPYNPFRRKQTVCTPIKFNVDLLAARHIPQNMTPRTLTFMFQGRYSLPDTRTWPFIRRCKNKEG